MSDHQWAVDLATKLIDENGRDVELISRVNIGPDYNPTFNTTSTTVKAVNTSFNQSEIPAGLVDQVTAVYLIDSSVTINNSMQIQDVFTYSILQVIELKPGDQSILYRVFVGG